MPGGTGAYSDSRGAMVLRKDIAKVCPIRDDNLAVARVAYIEQSCRTRPGEGVPGAVHSRSR